MPHNCEMTLVKRSTAGSEGQGAKSGATFATAVPKDLVGIVSKRGSVLAHESGLERNTPMDTGAVVSTCACCGREVCRQREKSLTEKGKHR